MSSPPPVRRSDKLMSDDRARAFLSRGHCARVATVGADGSPYCTPLLYVCMDGELLMHNSAAPGHFRTNVDHEPRVCVIVDEPGEVFDYGRFECDVSIARKGRRVNAKSFMGVMMLAAGKGSRVMLETDGPDEAEALDAIIALVANCFGERGSNADPSSVA